eukprot:scaffold8056_cov25-Cyclotella_meneghiniana.AAC.1
MSSTPEDQFRAKTAFMKTWRPNNPPSTQDKLNLYALHNQSVSGDAPDKDDPDASAADKAKLSAWRSKRGMKQSEAMAQYVVECDRQIQLYGTKDGKEKKKSIQRSISEQNSKGRF